jgi:hypothetical protein
MSELKLRPPRCQALFPRTVTRERKVKTRTLKGAGCGTRHSGSEHKNQAYVGSSSAAPLRGKPNRLGGIWDGERAFRRGRGALDFFVGGFPASAEDGEAEHGEENDDDA